METTAFESVDRVVEEIMRIHRSLPSRPGVEEVDAGAALVCDVEKEDQARLDAIAKQTNTSQVPEDLFMVLQEMQRSLVYFQSKEQKREALKLLDLENLHNLFDDFIQRASTCVSTPNSSSSTPLKTAAAANSSSGAGVPLKPSPSSFSASAAYAFRSDKDVVGKSSLNESEQRRQFRGQQGQEIVLR